MLLHKVARRLSARSLFARFVVSCLFIALLFSGCKQELDDPNLGYDLDSRLIGTWTAIQGDSYTITATHLSYGYGADFISYAGTIRAVTTFSGTAGVIIIEYDNNHKASYPKYDENWNPTGEYHQLTGNFIGVYYQDFQPEGSIKIGGAYIDGGAEEPTLDAAKKAFTLDKEGDYMGFYGTYQK